jgi:heme exporter protein B
MLAIILKDALIESRTRETVFSLFILGVLILLIFNFAIDVAPSNIELVAPGVLWLAIIFSSSLALGRALQIERDNGCMDALLLAPVDRGTIFLAKLCVNILLLSVFELFLVPVFSFMYQIDLLSVIPSLVCVLFAGTVGLAAAGTLFALAAAGTRARELMLPLLVLPLQIPLLIAVVRATALVFEGHGIGSLGAWGNLILSFDILFVAVGWLAFESVAVE